MKMKPQKGALETMLGVVAGAVAGKIIMNKLPVENEMVKALIPVGAGFFLTSQKQPLMKGLGYGMIGSGGISLAGALVPGISEAVSEPVNAPEDMEEIFMGEDEEPEMLNAPANQSILSAPANQSILSGEEEMETMFSDLN